MDPKPLVSTGRGRDMARRDWSPFDTLQREIDRLFAEFGRYPPIFRTPDLTPTIDVTETDKEIEIKAAMAKGVLKVTVPKPAPAVTKKVEIKSAA